MYSCGFTLNGSTWKVLHRWKYTEGRKEGIRGERIEQEDLGSSAHRHFLRRSKFPRYRNACLFRKQFNPDHVEGRTILPPLWHWSRKTLWYFAMSLGCHSNRDSLYDPELLNQEIIHSWICALLLLLIHLFLTANEFVIYWKMGADYSSFIRNPRARQTNTLSGNHKQWGVSIY